MEPLAFVEVVGRNGEVTARHPVYRWPARVGRAYDAEVILDDRFVAPHHVEIIEAAEGRFTVTDLQSANGISVPPSRARVTSSEVGPDNTVRIGRAEIRIRPRSYAVPPELRFRATAFYRRPAAFAMAAVMLPALVAWISWLRTTQPEEIGLVIYPVVYTMIVLGIWVSIWSLVGKTVGGRANFAAHGFIVCVGIAAVMCAPTLFEYLAFSLNAGWLDAAGTVAAAAIIAYVVYRQLRLNSRASRRWLGAVSLVVVLAATGIVFGFKKASESAWEGQPRYSGVIKPAGFVIVQGTPVGMFLSSAEKLRARVDQQARSEQPTEESNAPR
jgi:hypothetical protein